MVNQAVLLAWRAFQKTKTALGLNRPVRRRSIGLPNEDTVFLETDKAGIMILNRPEYLNAINLSMIHCMTRQLQEYEKSKSHVILKSAVPKTFSAGGDVVGIHDFALKNEKSWIYSIRYGYELIHFVSLLRIPLISLVDGLALGGGIGLATRCKYCVCTENMSLATPEVKIGIFPDVGASYYMSRLKNHLGFYLSLTGAKVVGYDNVRVGIATHFCESTTLPQLEKALSTTDNVEETLDSFCSKPKNSKFFFEPYVEKIDRIFSSNTVEEILDKLKEDGTPWAKKTIQIFRLACPLALKVTLHNLHLAKTLPLGDCLQNEYILSNGLMCGENFYEGLRANLIEKDYNPKWNPQRLEDVTPQMVEDLYKVKPLLGQLQFKHNHNKGLQDSPWN